VWDSGPFGPACSDSLRGQRGARGPSSPQKTTTAFSPPSSLFAPTGSFLGARVTGREQIKGVRAGSLSWADPLRLVSAFGALARVSLSASYSLTAGRVNPDGGVSCIGGNYLHRRYLAARDRAN